MRIAILASLLCLTACSSAPRADLVILGGSVYTMNTAQPLAGVVAVKDGRIIAVEDRAMAEAWRARAAQVLDLEGRTMTPGLIESHGHLLGLGHARLRLDLKETRSYDEMVEMVAGAVAAAEPGEWILGRGWHQSKWSPQPEPMVAGFQTHAALSGVSPDNPVLLTHASGHAAIANAKAMAMAGVNSGTVYQGEGEVIKDNDGNPTGIFVELAAKLISRHITEPGPQADIRAVRLAVEECLANGITTFCDAGARREAIAAYEAMLSDNELPMRLWVMLSSRQPGLLSEYFEAGPQIGRYDGFLTIRSIKLYGDGALGTRSAWLLEPYSDRPGHTGHETMPMDSIYLVAAQALEHGFQACTHAIGDRANHEVLNAYERAFSENPGAATDHRFRIEHAQHLDEADIPRFSELGVIASMQGIHMSSDRPWAIDRLGEERIEEGAYVWQKLLKSGARVVNGTDVPVEPVSPLACFYASVTRQTLAGTPEGGYEASQRMTREQALRSYTLDAAYAAFEDDVKGSIEKGKYADFTIFSNDIMQVDAAKLLQTRVDYTIVNGQMAFVRDH